MYIVTILIDGRQYEPEVFDSRLEAVKYVYADIAMALDIMFKEAKKDYPLKDNGVYYFDSNSNVEVSYAIWKAKK